jgi:hypothetical protein
MSARSVVVRGRGVRFEELQEVVPALGRTQIQELMREARRRRLMGESSKVS